MLEEEALTKQDAAREERQEELERTFSYDGYQVVRKELFAHLRDPAIVIQMTALHLIRPVLPDWRMWCMCMSCSIRN